MSGVPASGTSTFLDRFHDALRADYGIDLEVRSIGDEFRDEYAAADPDVPFPEWWEGLPMEEQQAINDRYLEKVRTGEIDVADTRYVHIYNEENGCNTFRVFLHASLRTRAERIVGERYEDQLSDSLSREEKVAEIMDILTDREQGEVDIGRELWTDWEERHGEPYDYRDPEHYHATLNTAQLTPEEEAELVTAAITA